jgi:hypothetical protein
MKAHWRYLIARYAAWPVVWCAAGEANLPWYLAKGFPYDDRKQVADWTEVMRSIRAVDPFHRPLTVHPTAIKRYTARHATDDPSLIDFDMLQTPHGQGEAAATTLKAVVDSYADQPRMPVIDGEAAYEMLSDSLPTEWTRRMFWLCMMNGAAGHTYGANGIWQCNRPEQPHGASPHGGSYGKISWSEAMHLPGSSQLGWAKSFLQRYPWYQFEPHREWASFADDGSEKTASQNFNSNQPQATGIDSIRIIYVPEAKAIELRDLDAKSKYVATYFDPVSGDTRSGFDVQPDQNGRWKSQPPTGSNHDWVVAFEKRK